jgi:hypothetical protein
MPLGTDLHPTCRALSQQRNQVRLHSVPSLWRFAPVALAEPSHPHSPCGLPISTTPAQGQGYTDVAVVRLRKQDSLWA